MPDVDGGPKDGPGHRFPGGRVGVESGMFFAAFTASGDPASSLSHPISSGLTRRYIR